jgi:CRP/FNR family transcriptional regulator
MKLASTQNQATERINTCTVGLNRCNCFLSLTPEEQILLDQNTVEVKFGAGEMVCKQGTFATHIIYVCKGLLKVYMESKHEQLILKIIPEENLAGLNSLFSGNNVFVYSISTYIPSVIKMIDINVFRRIINQNAQFASDIIGILNSNMIQTYGRFFSITQRQSYGRLADILLCLSERIFRKQEFILELSRKELAELCGMTTENVIRMLKKLRDEDLIQIDGKKFSIKNVEQLRKIRELG